MGNLFEFGRLELVVAHNKASYSFLGYLCHIYLKTFTALFQVVI